MTLANMRAQGVRSLWSSAISATTPSWAVIQQIGMT
jgi:hypothetical protein